MGGTYSSKLQDSPRSCQTMVVKKLPQENLISLAFEFNRIVLLGNYETDPERWDKVTKKLDEKDGNTILSTPSSDIPH